ncbi:hypothetical protein [Gluconobacter cadivus]
MRRFILNVLPSGFHRIRHYDLFISSNLQVSPTKKLPQVR